MSDPKQNPLLAAVAKTLQHTLQCIQRGVNAKAVIIVVVHQDASIQSAAAISPEALGRASAALKGLTAKIERGEIDRIEISNELKN